MRQLIGQNTRHHQRSPGMPRVSAVVLAFVAGLTLLMPVNYRAGAYSAHTHTIFQIWIDAAMGRSHHHQDGEVEQQQDAIALDVHDLAGHKATNAFAHALELPHLHAPDGDAVILGDAPVTQQPDNAEPVTTTMPIQHATELAALGVLIALLLADVVGRSQWASVRRLTGIPHILEPPPPRLTPC